MSDRLCTNCPLARRPRRRKLIVQLLQSLRLGFRQNDPDAVSALRLLSGGWTLRVKGNMWRERIAV
eukprot:2264821-Pleurochrysis_carterae.AAC.9